MGQPLVMGSLYSLHIFLVVFFVSGKSMKGKNKVVVVVVVVLACGLVYHT